MRARSSFDVVPGEIRIVTGMAEPLVAGWWLARPTGRIRVEVLVDARVPAGFQVRIDGTCSTDPYAAVGPEGRVGPRVSTFEEALERCLALGRRQAAGGGG